MTLFGLSHILRVLILILSQPLVVYLILVQLLYTILFSSFVLFKSVLTFLLD